MDELCCHCGESLAAKGRWVPQLTRWGWLKSMSCGPCMVQYLELCMSGSTA